MQTILSLGVLNGKEMIVYCVTMIERELRMQKETTSVNLPASLTLFSGNPTSFTKKLMNSNTMILLVNIA